MAMSFAFRRRARAVLAASIGIAAIGYFGYHALHGQRGIGDWFRLSSEIERLERRATLNRARIDVLERRVALLGEASLDRDLLDERARHVLGLAGAGEFVVLDP